MDKPLLVKSILNKKNGQVNISLPKKQLPKDFFDKIKEKPFLRITIKGLSNE